MFTQGNYASNQISLADELAFRRLESKASNSQSVKITPDEIQAFEEQKEEEDGLPLVIEDKLQPDPNA